MLERTFAALPDMPDDEAWETSPTGWTLQVT
jgi:hypothetical protein